MTYRDLYAELPAGRDPSDASFGKRPPRVEWDEIVFRAGHSSISIPDMPEETKIGRVTIRRTVGPVLTQRTLIRQAHGLPIVFDKSMQLNVPVGENQVITVCEIRAARREDLGAAFNEWREEAQSALGVLAAVLDDRVAIDPLFEDAILLSQGIPVYSAETRSRLRTFYPFEITPLELDILEGLGSIEQDKLSEASEAARWYAKAFREGPTADGVVYLWIAVESLTPHPTTSPKKVEALLKDFGFDPATLGDISIGRMADVRAKIVHDSQRDHGLIKDSYYRLESIVRVLLRGTLGIASSWPSAIQVASFGPNSEIVLEALRHQDVDWHKGQLPPPEEPNRVGLPWLNDVE